MRDAKATDPVDTGGSGGTVGSPAERVDFGVVHPGDLGETSSVEEVVHEEHGRRDTTVL